MNNRHPLLRRNSLAASLLAISLLGLTPMAQGESLFRAGAEYRVNQPYTPPSLFTQPLPKSVGDIITITINETATLTTNAELKVTRTQTIDSNGSNLFNQMLSFLGNKLPFGGRAVSDALSAPSFNGLDSANNLGSKAESTRQTTLTDSVSCQVVQVLPNGFLMVQGKKTTEINRDHQDLYVSGIVNPYYLDQFNQIPSSRVGNFQLMQGGKGVVSRQQSDGIANKIYQFFN